MYKIYIIKPGIARWLHPKFWLIMRYTIIIMIASLMQVSAATLAQKITINKKNTTLIHVLKELRNQTDYNFVITDDQIEKSKNVTLQVRHVELKDALEALFKNQELSFRIADKTIIVTDQVVGSTAVSRHNFVHSNVTVRGTIVDEQKQPLPGVSVRHKETGTVVLTNGRGDYLINIEQASGTLVFSFVGYHTQEIMLNQELKVDVTMKAEVSAIDEVVVVGYGAVKKSDLTGAVSTVKAEEMAQRPAASVNQVLAGRVPGANVTTSSGRPGGNTSVRIRGNTSISITNNPLYVVDGVILNVGDLPSGMSPINFINAGDIASVEVLKDASATAIYGARGANGVILISTKRGNKSGGRLDYNSDYSIGTLPKQLDVLNAREFLAVEDLAYQNAQKYDPSGWAAGRYTDPKLKRTDPRLFDAQGNPLYDTDWQKEAFRNAFTNNQQLALTGGKDNDTYGAYLAYRNENGLIKESWLKRYSGRFFFDSELKSWWKMSGNLSYNDQDESQVDDMGHGGITVTRQIVEALPILPVKYADGSWAGNRDYPGMEGGNSPLQLINDRQYRLNTQTTIGNINSSIRFMEGLELRTVLGVNVINQGAKSYAGRDLVWISADQKGQAYVSNNKMTSYQFENYLTYDKRFDQHSINGMLGLSWQHVDQYTAAVTTQNFADDFFGYNNLGAGSSPQAPSSSTFAYGLNSYFGRINYGYKDRYLVTFTARADGSSKFGSTNRFAFFPSMALAWKASEENFMKGQSVISNLKLRSSYGETGNSEIAAYQAFAGLGNYAAIFNDQRVSGIGIQRLANPDLKWEMTRQVDAGLELGFFNNRISLEADIYYKKTSDMLLSAPVPSTSGYTNVMKNIGSMENKGVELTLTTKNIQQDDFSWTSTFNLSINKNKVSELGEANDDIFPGPNVLNQTNVIRVGHPVGSFFGYNRLGVWGTNEATEAARYGRLPGDLKLQDMNNDGQINDRDRVILGKGIPDGYGTFSNNFRYKNWDFLIEIQYMYGNDVLDISKHSAEDRTGQANSFASVLHAWTPENQQSDIAQIRPVAAGYQTNIDSHFVEDGSFIRGRNLLLGYTFPTALTDRLRLRNLRVFGTVQNFFLLTKYKGYDPEVSSFSQTFAQGITVFGYPKPRTFMVGINVGF